MNAKPLKKPNLGRVTKFRGPNDRSRIIRLKILEALQGEPINISQICRIIHGAKGKHDIDFCNLGKRKDAWRDPRGFASKGNNALYLGCHECKPGYGTIYRGVNVLCKKGFIEKRKEYRTDPIVPGAKDWMVMCALKGKLPRITNFTQEKQTKRIPP